MAGITQPGWVSGAGGSLGGVRLTIVQDRDTEMGARSRFPGGRDARVVRAEKRGTRGLLCAVQVTRTVHGVTRKRRGQKHTNTHTRLYESTPRPCVHGRGRRRKARTVQQMWWNESKL